VGFLRRDKPENSRPLFSGTPAELSRIGITAFGGDSPHPPGWAGVPTSELDSYAIAFLDAAGYPATASPEYAAARGGFLVELNTAASAGDDWTSVGAFMVARNTLVEMETHPGYLSLVDRGVEVLRLDGVSFPSIPPFALERYEQVYGNSGLGPANWPSALVNVDVPVAGSDPPTHPLTNGEARRVAEIQAQGAPRQIFAESRNDGRIFAVLEGAVDDGTVKRWDWPGVEAPDYVSFLRELGERLVTPSPWFHEDLAPYFPCRPKSRDEMRAEARAARV
jgi:hypothetical protein